ncbi:acyltransferase family protein [Pseudarthrobacter sp. NPDC092424]|uniref:acyltransferase family protein n=1 Tax=Pseudarthrobacter sp. NPDC092424 TaxID=3364415 RepID=UPI00381B9F84
MQIISGGTLSILTRRIEIIDYCRFLAAMMVLVYHYLFAGIANGKVESIAHTSSIGFAKYGYLGVDFFFLISGFVIAVSVQGKTARQFAVGRALRLYPAFWAAVLLTSSFAFFWGGPQMSVTIPQIFANLTMVPEYFGHAPIDGVYWTLLAELKFYALVFLLVLIGQAHRLDLYMALWAMGMAALTFLHPALAEVPFLGNYYLLFAAGALVAAIGRSGWSIIRTLGLIAAYVAALKSELVRAADISSSWGSQLSPSVVLVLVTAFFCILLAVQCRHVANLSLPGAATVGAMTYPVYLIHAHIGYMMLDRFATEANKWLVYLILVTMVLAIAYVLHRTVEQYPRRQWRRLFDHTVGSGVELVNTVASRMVKQVRASTKV